MIDFNNKALFKLKGMPIADGQKIVSELLIHGEGVIAAFNAIRDSLIFTNKRIISVNVQGITGKKIDYTSIPYSKIQVFSIETAGTLDLDAELDVTISGIGTIRFELKSSENIRRSRISAVKGREISHPLRRLGCYNAR